MTSFEDLPLGPETVASLAAEGIETPTPFQAAAIPVIARGNDLMGRAGPGSGTLVGYGVPLLDRLEGGQGAPVCLVLCAGQRQATELARSFARLCEASGARAAALAENWLLPETRRLPVRPRRPRAGAVQPVHRRHARPGARTARRRRRGQGRPRRSPRGLSDRLAKGVPAHLLRPSLRPPAALARPTLHPPGHHRSGGAAPGGGKTLQEKAIDRRVLPRTQP